tara:strand:+ start:2411 stop:3511 length:1101 start_codon:yes stop_codon:yes gene_type:complete
MNIEYWSKSYQQSKVKFKESIDLIKSKNIAVKYESLDIGELDTEGNSLSIDIAWIGDKNAKKLYLSTSGIHGVEGFAGSAIQLSVIDNLEKIPDDTAIALVHIMNPWGMAWLRRENESNVDLNRNFLPLNEEYSGCHEHYPILNPLINISKVAKRNDFFNIKLALHTLYHGKTKTKQAYAEGQYTYPKGLHFGGFKLEKGPSKFIDWLKKNLKNVKDCVWIDLHTGLGETGEDCLLVDLSPKDKKFTHLTNQKFGNRIMSLDPKAGIAYKIRGGMQKGIELLFPEINWTSITQEFGTLKGYKVIQALRAENSWTHYGNYDNNTVLNHWSKCSLLEAFRPSNDYWENKIMTRGLKFYKQSFNYLLEN